MNPRDFENLQLTIEERINYTLMIIGAGVGTLAGFIVLGVSLFGSTDHTTAGVLLLILGGVWQLGASAIRARAWPRAAAVVKK